MATQSEAQAVKSLNNGAGRKRYTFKTFSQRINEIDIDVYRSLDPQKAEPSEGSTFFRDCLVQWRELNTAEDFISFYEEMMPLVQTLPQIILQKELILSSLLSRLQMKGRLSIEPILRLIAALSRDLLEDFIPFLARIADSLVLFLKSGADKESEIIEQIFTMWSCIMVYLQKHLVRDVKRVLNVTVELRYYSKDYIQEFMAESVSFLLRNAPHKQLKQGVRETMTEVDSEPTSIRKSGVSALFFYVMRGSPSRLHSRAEHVLQLLIGESVLGIGTGTIAEVVIMILQRLCEELMPSELKLILCCLHDEIVKCISVEYSMRLRRLLPMLISIIQIGPVQKITDYESILQLIQLLVQTFMVKREEQSSEVDENILQLMLCSLDGLLRTSQLTPLSGLSLDWAPVFKLRNSSFRMFLKELMFKDPCILDTFKTGIISALADFIAIAEDEAIYLLLTFCEKWKFKNSGLLDDTTEKGLERIRICLKDAVKKTTDALSKDPSCIHFQETDFARLWGIVRCFSYVVDVQSSQSLLMNLVDVLDRLLRTAHENTAGFPKHILESLIAAALDSHHKNKLHISWRPGSDNSALSKDLGKHLYFAEKYNSSTHILGTVADFVVSVDGSIVQVDSNSKIYPSELKAARTREVFDIFAENLCHPDKRIRLSTLRILCCFEPIEHESSASNNQHPEKKSEAVDSETSNVLQLLLSIEQTPLSITTSRTVALLVTKIQMAIATGRVSATYLPLVLYGMIGILHNRFSPLWNPAIECLGVLIGHCSGMVSEKYEKYLEKCISDFLLHNNQYDKSSIESSIDSSDLVGRFNEFIALSYDSTPCGTVLSSLIQTLQKVPSVTESRSSKITPLFLKFLGYDIGQLSSVKAFNSRATKGKEWKAVLQEWLNLLKLMRNPKSFCARSNLFLKDVLQYRLLDENDAEVQLKVLESLLNWKDDFLLPYSQHLKSLTSAKTLREELTTWSLSRDSNFIEEEHRPLLIPIVVRILVPKIRTMKALASRKLASVNYRKAVIRFLTGLDASELPVLFALLIKPLQAVSEGVDAMDSWLWGSPKGLEDFDSCCIMRRFTLDNIHGLSPKKLFGFLHVIDDIFGVFDEFLINPFLDLLMGCVVRILACCVPLIDSLKGSGLSLVENSIRNEGSREENQVMTTHSIKQFKDLRSLCLKIISVVLNKYENHDFGPELWDLFFSSVKPLIDGFKQEGGSSEKPSSLFVCFLAMSKSCKLVPLLSREKNLVPDIFSILSVTTASESILSCVLRFIENLLNLDQEMMDTDDNDVRKILLPNIGALICSLHRLFTCKNMTNRKLVKYPGEQELNIFKLLSKFIKDPSAGRNFIDILLPFLNKKPHNPDACVETLRVIRDIIPMVGSDFSVKVLNTVSPLLVSGTLDVRLSICDTIEALAKNDISLCSVAELLREFSATSEEELGGLDYGKVIAAYEKISYNFFDELREEHALIILSHCVNDMSSQELILRESAYRVLLLFVEFSGKILGHDVKSNDDNSWSGVRIVHMIKCFFLKHMGDAMSKDTSIQKVWIDLLREMVLKLAIPDFQSYQLLCSEDAEQDFFNNIIHLQKHRRARALSRFCSVVISGKLSEIVTTRVFLPLFFHMLLEAKDGKGEHLRNAAVEAIASISGCMGWKPYYTLLMRCFREMRLKPDKQKLFIRLICSVLDRFHFLEADSKDEVQTWLHKTMFPNVQKLIASDTDKVNINSYLVALKLLKLLPSDIMDMYLPNIIHHVSNFLKNRLESVREEARLALSACLKELGFEYLQFIVRALKATLKRGYEVHVLGYTLNFLLSKCLPVSVSGELDYCFEELLSIAENDILGDVSEEKEVDKIASKMKETRKQKSFETLKLIAQSITFRTNAMKLLQPVKVHLHKQIKPKLKSKLESILSHIASGIESNPSANDTDLFIFTYGLIQDEITEQTQGRGASQCSHLLLVFALGILLRRIKKMKGQKDEQLLSLLDPFVNLLSVCLNSKHEDIISGALSCLLPLVKLPLPSLKSQADKIKSSLLDIAEGSVNVRKPLTESCLRLLTVLLKSTSITLSSDQLAMLIQFPVFVDLESNPSFIALSLLKAIVNRKLVVPEVYDLATRVSKLMVTSQVEPIRKKCMKIFLQFLLDYCMEKRRLEQHLDYLLANLRYVHPTGREAVLEMLHDIINKFPRSVVDGQSRKFFIQLVLCLANDHDNKIRSMAGAAIKELIGHVSKKTLEEIFDHTFSWYSVGERHLWSSAAQVLGLLVEVMKKDFKKHSDCIFPVMSRIMQSALSVMGNRKQDLSNEAAFPLWKEAYYSLVMLEKILIWVPDSLGTDLEFFGSQEMWEMVCKFLLHPHIWLRNISSRLLALYFGRVKATCMENREKTLGGFFLMRSSRLFMIAASLCVQLTALSTDDSCNNCLRDNIIFAICGLHSVFGLNTDMRFETALDDRDKGRILEAFQLLDPRKGRGMFLSFTSDLNSQSGPQNNGHHQNFLVSSLIKNMGKVALQMESIQMKLVVDVFKSISPRILGKHKDSTGIDEYGSQDYAYQMLSPLYKICEGYAGKVISDDVKQFAQEVRDGIRDTLGVQDFVQVYGQIKKNLKAKRDKRRQEEKQMAVTDPMRNAKRKLRIAEKHRANKKRKTMHMKFGRSLRL